MAHGNITIPVPGELRAVDVNGRVVSADGVYDYNESKSQETINAEVKEAIGTGGSVDTRISAAINALDSTKSQSAGADGLALSITEENGKITSISGSIASGTYDAAGSASAAQSAAATDATNKVNAAKSELLGDAASDYNTLGKLEDKIQAEASRAEGAESTIEGKVTAEKNRAEAVEGALDSRVDTLETAVGTGGSVDSRISSAVNAAKSEIKGTATSACDTLGEAEALISSEVSRAQQAESSLSTGKADKATTLAGYGITDAYTKSETYTKTEVNGLVDTPHQEYVTVATYSALPATGSKDTIYRVSNYNGSTSQVDASVYSEYAWDGSQYIFLCVKSQIDEVFDISAYNNNAKYADLAAALNGGANIPQSLQKGGMSVKFVQSSDNKYVKFFCTADEFTTDITKWQGVDDEPTAGSDNLVKSGGVYSTLYDKKSFDTETGVWNTTKLIDFNFEAGKTYAFKVNSFTSGSNLGQVTFTLKGEGLEDLRVSDKNGGYVFLVGTEGTATPNAQYTRLQIYVVYKTVPNPNTDTLNYDCYEVNPNAIDRRLTNLEDLAEKTSDDLEAEINRAQEAEEENATNISNVGEQVSEIANAITKTEVKDVTSQLVFIDNQPSHYIKEDGSFGEDAMYLMRYNVGGGFSIDLKTRAYVNAEIKSLMYAFYSSDSVFDATTFISGSRVYTGAHVSQESFENVSIPSNAKTIVFADRGGGVTQLVITYKNIDVANGESIKQILDYPASKTIKYIKSDGTGDYTTIQEAINSITDASFVNQYELRLCNDEIYTNVTDLWLVKSPSTHNANANPTYAIAAIITKDWISIVGYGGRRKVAVYAPDTMDVTKLGNVQTVYLMGNTTIDNVDFEIKNGRYAIHQESAGSTSSLDHNARTIIKNSNITHLGNKTGEGYWGSCYAQANGTCSGLQLEYHNVVWSPAFYMHQNGNVETNNSYLFKNCRIDYPANGEFDNKLLGVYIGMNGSGQNPDIQFYGCDMWQMTFVIDMFDNNVAADYAHDIRSYIPNWVGYGNAIMKYPQIDIVNHVLTFRTNDVNHSISVVGGTAKPLIYGDGFRTYSGTPNAWGICYGSEYIGKRGNNTVYTLGSRLGDCSATNKTLVVKYDSTEYTLTFNEDYTSMDTDTIYQKIDAMLSSLGVDATTTTQLIHQLQFSYPMKDTSIIGRNYSTLAFQNGAALKRDYAHGMGWTLCSEGETPDGVACERINPNGSGVIALIDKNYFPPLFGLYGGVKPVGTMLKTVADGKWQETTTESEAILIAVAPDCFVKK